MVNLIISSHCLIIYKVTDKYKYTGRSKTGLGWPILRFFEIIFILFLKFIHLQLNIYIIFFSLLND